MCSTRAKVARARIQLQLRQIQATKVRLSILDQALITYEDDKDNKYNKAILMEEGVLLS